MAIGEPGRDIQYAIPPTLSKTARVTARPMRRVRARPTSNVGPVVTIARRPAAFDALRREARSAGSAADPAEDADPRPPSEASGSPPSVGVRAHVAEGETNCGEIRSGEVRSKLPGDEAGAKRPAAASANARRWMVTVGASTSPGRGGAKGLRSAAGAASVRLASRSPSSSLAALDGLAGLTEDSAEGAENADTADTAERRGTVGVPSAATLPLARRPIATRSEDHDGVTLDGVPPGDGCSPAAPGLACEGVDAGARWDLLVDGRGWYVGVSARALTRYGAPPAPDRSAEIAADVP